MLAKLFAVAAAAAMAAAQDSPVPPVCLLYIDGHSNQFTFGVLTDAMGETAVLVTLPTWTEVGNGIDAGLDNTTFYAQPEVSGRARRKGKIAIDDIKRARTSNVALRAHSAAGTAPLATIKIKSPVHADVTYATLGPVPGHSQPTALADMSADTTRNAMVGTVEATAGGLLFVLADVDPSSGTVGPVWRDITSEWASWAWMKYGVSTYDAQGQVYYLTVGIPNATDPKADPTETVLGFPLNSGAAPLALPLPGTEYDILSLDWSTRLGGPVITCTDRGKNTVTVLGWSSTSGAWDVIFSYPPGTVVINQLGQSVMTPDGDLILTLEPATGGQGWAFSVSQLSLTARKEVARVAMKDNLDLLADIVLCNL